MKNLLWKIRLLPALAYASPFDVPELFAAVVKQLPMPAAQRLVLYFERTYIGRTLPGGTFREPLFPVEFWNHHLEVRQGFPKTTNYLTMLLSVANIQTYGDSLLL